MSHAGSDQLRTNRDPSEAHSRHGIGAGIHPGMWLRMTDMPRLDGPILVTGATGYVGGRLVTRLLEEGHEVRCLARTPAKALRYDWADRAEVVAGDVTDPQSLRTAMEGCAAAFYLVHSLGDDGFEEEEARAAEHFRAAAAAAGVGRIVYLGGIVPDDDRDLSPHLASRKRVGEILATGPTPVTELRAAVIIGSGSISFEMLRYLTDVLPVMTTPRWVRTRCQPIAIRDVLAYLVAAVADTSDTSHVVPIGGRNVLSYQEMMQVYAEEAGLRRRIILPVPMLSPGLSSLWVGLVTPLPSGIASQLIDSLIVDVVVSGDAAATLFPDIEPVSYRHAVRRALRRLEDAAVPTRWSDAGAFPADPLPGDPEWAGGTVFDERREVASPAPPGDMYWAVARIGGSVGYYVMNWAWALRGLLDQLVGGPGLRRGRRHPTDLRPGESLDFWRVVDVEPGRCLELQAEMRVPGKAWLRFEIEETSSGSALAQTAFFAPKGLWGRMYWIAMFPFHALIFERMARAIAAAAEARRQQRVAS